VRVVLDVQRDGVPIRGWVSVGDGIKREFHGWLELADALESARAGTLVPDPPAAEPQPVAVALDPAALAPAVDRRTAPVHPCTRVLERRRSMVDSATPRAG
jgi:hypothetical protein